MMKNTIYLFVLSLLIGFSSSAFAANNCILLGVFDDAAVANQVRNAANAGVGSKNTVYNYSQMYCANSYTPSTVSSQFVFITYGSTVWFSELVASCPVGTQSVNHECKPACVAGDSSTASYYVPGYWSTGPGLGDVVQSTPYSPPVSLCDGQCPGGCCRYCSGVVRGASRWFGFFADCCAL